MHDCQACDSSQLMVPDGGAARCPRCGSVDRVAALEPVFMVVGSSGAGKTTLLPHLLEELRGRCAVFDMDWLIDPFGHQPGVTAVDWPSLRDAWLHVAHGVAQNGLPTLVLGSILPDQVADLRGRRWVGDIHWLVLDCPEDEQRRRLAARPAWRAHDIEPFVAFAQWLRTNLDPVVDTSTTTPAGAAAQVASWVRDHLRTD